MKVLHLSGSHLAGAPSMLSNALNRWTNVSSEHLVLGKESAIPGLSNGSIVLSAPTSDVHDEVLREAITKCDAIHVHQDLPLWGIQRLVEMKKTRLTPFVYHAHSPVGEAPHFGNAYRDLGFRFSAMLVVPHVAQRFYPDFTMIPNVFFRTGAVSGPSWGGSDSVDVLYSPSGFRGGLWSKKSSLDFERELRKISRELRIVRVTRVEPLKLLSIRAKSRMSIDEVVSGGLHLVTYEAFFTGSVPIVNTDELNLASFRAAVGANGELPIVRTNVENMGATIANVLGDDDLLVKLSGDGLSFFSEYLNPEKILSQYLEIYARL